MQNTLLCISLALIAGLLMTRPAKRVGLPAVTAYLLTGLLLGPYCLGRLGLGGLFRNAAEVISLPAGGLYNFFACGSADPGLAV